MKLFRNIFAYETETKVPDDIAQRVNENKFDSLPDGLIKFSGFAMITEESRVIHSDNRWLFKYVEQARVYNRTAVKSLYEAQLKKASDAGHLSTWNDETQWEQAEREVLKYSPIREGVVYIIFDESAGRVWCSGSTAKKCEEALSRLRKVLGSLRTYPVVYAGAPARLAQEFTCSASGLPDNLFIPEDAKVVAVSDGQKVMLDGMNLRDKSVSGVLESLAVQSLEMQLVKRWSNGERDTLADFVLHIAPSGPVSLKRFAFDGSQATEDGEEAHHYAAMMLITAKSAWEIMSALALFFIGSDSQLQPVTQGD